MNGFSKLLARPANDGFDRCRCGVARLERAPPARPAGFATPRSSSIPTSRPASSSNTSELAGESRIRRSSSTCPIARIARHRRCAAVGDSGRRSPTPQFMISPRSARLPAPEARGSRPRARPLGQDRPLQLQLMDPMDSIATGHDIVRRATSSGTRAPQGARCRDKDKGAKNDEHVPEGASPIPGTSEWTENLFKEGDWRVTANAWAGFGLRVLLICGTLFSVFQYMAQRQEMQGRADAAAGRALGAARIPGGPEGVEGTASPASTRQYPNLRATSPKTEFDALLREDRPRGA